MSSEERAIARLPVPLREIAFFILFLILSVAMTWPLVRNLGSAVSDPGDPFLNAWILKWDYWATFHQPLALYDANIFYPARYALAFSENMYGLAVLLFPFYAAGMGSITVYNVAMLAGFAFCGYGAFVLCRMITRSTPAAIAGGTFFAFVPFRFDHLAHIQHVWAGWLPILLAALLYFHRRPTRKRAALFAAAFVMNGLTNIHWLMFGSVMVILTFLFMTCASGEWRARQHWTRFIGALLVAGLILLPFLVPYVLASNLYEMKRHPGETLAGSATPVDWLIAAGQNRIYGNLAIARGAAGERKLFPGLLVLVLGLIALLTARREDFSLEQSGTRPDPVPWPGSLRFLDGAIAFFALMIFIFTVSTVHWRLGGLEIESKSSYAATTIFVILLIVRLWRRFPAAWGGADGMSMRTLLRRSRFPLEVWAALLWIVVGFIGSLGMRAFFHHFLFRIYLFQSIRTPARWAMITYVGLACLASIGTMILLRKRRGVGRVLTASVIVMALLVELRAAPIAWHLTNPEVSEAYHWLRDKELRGGVVELPFGTFHEARYVLSSAEHFKPLLNGVSGFYPRLHEELVGMWASSPVNPSLLPRLEKLGTSLIFLHADLVDDRRDVVTPWLEQALRSGQLIFIGRFDAAIHGIYVFAFPRVEPDSWRWRQAELPDGSGRTPTQNLLTFLAGDSRSYNHSPFGALDRPRLNAEIRGELEVYGWALSPHGIREVNLFLQNGSRKYKANLIPRTDVTQIYPWYPQKDRAGFRAVLPRRPDGVAPATDLRVEIVDGAGRRAFLNQTWFHWTKLKDFPRVGPDQWRVDELAGLLQRLGRQPQQDLPRIRRGEISVRTIVVGELERKQFSSDEAFIRGLYQALLGRDAEADGLQDYLEKLAGGSTRRSIIESLLLGDEFQRKYLLQPDRNSG